MAFSQTVGGAAHHATASEVFCFLCLALKGRVLMGALTARRATSWRMGDVCRAVVSAITLTTLRKMDTNPAKSKWICPSSPGIWLPGSLFDCLCK